MLRYIVRFPSDIFPHTTSDSDYEDADTVVIEAQDINEDTSTGYTFSKHYSGYEYGRLVINTLKARSRLLQTEY